MKKHSNKDNFFSQDIRFDSFEKDVFKSIQRKSKYILLMAIVQGVCILGLFAGIVYAAVHFIHKFW